MRGALARLRRLGMLEAGPLPDGFASLESSLSVLSAAFAWGDVAASLEAGARSAKLEGPESPWRPVVTWSLGWGHYCNGELDLAERWLTETAALAPPADQWIVGTGAIADLSLIAGLRGRHAEQLRLATEAVDQAREHGLLEAREVGEVHTAHGVALAAHGRRGGGAARARAGGLPAPALGPAARSRRRADRARGGHGRRRGPRARRGALRRDRGAAGRVPRRRASCPSARRRPRSPRGRTAGRAERARARGPGAPEPGRPSARSARSCSSPSTRSKPREVHLPQARGRARGRRRSNFT